MATVGDARYGYGWRCSVWLRLDMLGMATAGDAWYGYGWRCSVWLRLDMLGMATVGYARYGYIGMAVAVINCW